MNKSFCIPTKFGYIILALMLFVVTGCKTPPSDKIVDTVNKKADSTQLVQDISIISLISNPALYNGKKIRLVGYLNLEFEGNAIYLHKEDYTIGVSKNAIWLNISKDAMHSKVYQDNNKKYVILEGTFNMLNNGHEGSFSGSIGNIARLESWNYER